MIVTQCPHCGSEFEAPENYEGQNTECSTCRKEFVIRKKNPGEQTAPLNVSIAPSAPAAGVAPAVPGVAPVAPGAPMAGVAPVAPGAPMAGVAPVAPGAPMAGVAPVAPGAPMAGVNPAMPQWMGNPGMAPGMTPGMATPGRMPYGGNLLRKRPKDRIAAGLLAIFAGSLGIHQFYLENTSSGIVRCCCSVFGSLLIVGPIAMWLIGVIEGIMYLCKDDVTWQHEYVENTKGWF